MNDKNEIPVSRYDYYKYYNNKKYLYKLNYEEKKKKDLLEKKHAEYYLDYYTNARWKTILADKNKIKINNNIIDEAPKNN